MRRTAALGQADATLHLTRSFNLVTACLPPARKISVLSEPHLVPSSLHYWATYLSACFLQKCPIHNQHNFSHRPTEHRDIMASTTS
jgi:hypothetical protein